MPRLTSLRLTAALAIFAAVPLTPAAVAAPSAALKKPAAAQFAAVLTASTGKPMVHGTYTNGCIAGASRLAADSPHWQVLKPSRNRAWGHPALVRMVEDVARQVAADGHRGVLVGDLAQARGGPMPYGHNSHQTGLDADIWLTPLPERRLTPDELESFAPPSMVDLEAVTVTPAFGPAQIAMLARAARHPDVERIFVSPPIKQALCEQAGDSDRAWLRKVRPWRGHTSHMHVRIACPADSDACKDQDPVPEGDGCGTELASWLADPSWRTPGKRPYVPEKGLKLNAMPAACRKLVK